MNPASTPTSERKFLKMDVQFEHPAKGRDHCSECVHFIPEYSRCRIVRGEVMGVDWCKKFKKGGPSQ